MDRQLQQLLTDNPHLWQGRHTRKNAAQCIPTGYAALDALLPGGGWPVDVLIEIITPCWGIGELQLLAPLMGALTRRQRWLLWIAPPYLPYAPALQQAGVDVNFVVLVGKKVDERDTLWSIEKALQTDACGLVLAWPGFVSNPLLRRLQLSAAGGKTLGVLFRQRETKNSPSALRLGLKPVFGGIDVKVLKARGTFQQGSAKIHFSSR